MIKPLMKVPAKIIIGIVAFILLLTAGLCYVSYQIGVKETQADYSKQVASITAAALDEQTKLQAKLDEISHAFFTTSNTERDRINDLQRQLRGKRDPVECTQDSGGNTVAIMPHSSVRLLLEATNYQSLQKATGQSCPFGEASKITANLWAEYTICIAGQYNGIAEQLVKLIDSVKEFQVAQRN